MSFCPIGFTSVVVGLVVGVICDPISSLQFFYGIYVLYGAIQINAGSLGLKRTNFVAHHSSSFFLSKGKQAASTLCNENENFVHSIAAAWWIDGTA